MPNTNVARRFIQTLLILRKTPYKIAFEPSVCEQHQAREIGFNGPALLKEDFQQFWQYNSPAWAAKLLDDWCDQVMRSRIEPMKKIAKTLRGHRQLILNYFRARKQFSSGVVEGLNNKAKLTMRKAYGFRTFRITEIALYHALGNLPQPHAAHRFY